MKRTILFALLAILTGISVYSIILPMQVTPISNLPDQEIVFSQWQPGDTTYNVFGFIREDGSDLETRTFLLPEGILFSSNPFRKYSSFISNDVYWSPNGKYLLFKKATTRSNLGYPILISTNGKLLDCSVKKLILSSVPFSFYSDTTIVAIINTGYRDQVVLFDMNTCKIKKIVNTAIENATITNATYSVNGDLAVSILKDQKGFIEIFSHGQSEAIIEDYGELVWSRDGQMLAFVGKKLGKGVLYTIQKDGSNLKWITYASGSPSWSPDGKWIVFSNERSEITKIDLVSNKTEKIADGSRVSWK